MTQEEFFRQWSLGNGEIHARTSGSTGRPKEVVLSGRLVLDSARRTNRFFGIDSRSRLHVPLDFDYIAAKMMGVRAAVSGAQLTSETPSNRPMSDRSRFPSDDRIDLLAVVPSQMEYILRHLEELPELGNIIIGGGMIPEKLKTEILTSGLSAWETYGMTETASHIALRRVGEEWFTTLEDLTVSQTEDSCLVIHIPGFTDIKTRDIAQVKNPRMFKILGRADNVINTGGKKIFAENLEKLLSEYWPGLNFAITSAPDDKWGERIAAIVESDEKDAEKLIACARAALDGYMVPKEIRFVDSLPRTSNGKINRAALRNLLSYKTH